MTKPQYAIMRFAKLKQMSRLTKLRKRIEATISNASFFNAKSKLDEVHTLLDDYIPSKGKEYHPHEQN